jgi:hypothetical protein
MTRELYQDICLTIIAVGIIIATIFGWNAL